MGSKVGAVLVRDDRVISTGYNGTPENARNCDEGGCYRCANRTEFNSGTGLDRCICVHAEQNAFLSAARFGIVVAGSELFTTSQPCFNCLKEATQLKLNRIYFDQVYPVAGFEQKYLADQYEHLVDLLPDHGMFKLIP